MKRNNEDSTPLAKIRTKAGFSVEKAAVNVNITSLTLRRYEHGISDIPVRIVDKLAELYKVPFETLRQAIKETPLKK